MLITNCKTLFCYSYYRYGLDKVKVHKILPMNDWTKLVLHCWFCISFIISLYGYACQIRCWLSKMWPKNEAKFIWIYWKFGYCILWKRSYFAYFCCIKKYPPLFRARPHIFALVLVKTLPSIIYQFCQLPKQPL